MDNLLRQGAARLAPEKADLIKFYNSMAAAEILLIFAVADISYKKERRGKMKEYKK